MLGIFYSEGRTLYMCEETKESTWKASRRFMWSTLRPFLNHDLTTVKVVDKEETVFKRRQVTRWANNRGTKLVFVSLVYAWTKKLNLHHRI